MKVYVKSIMENLKSVTSVNADFIFIDCTDSKNYAFYVSTDTQATKIPLYITDVADDEKQIYVINKSEFTHFVPYVNEFFNLKSDYSYNANDNAFNGIFEKNVEFSEELKSRKSLFDHEDDYAPFMEVTPLILSGLTSGCIFVKPDSIKSAERYLDIQNKKVFSYSDMKIYLNDIEVPSDGILSNDVVKALQSLGVGAVVKNNRDSYLLTNAQRSIFEYFSNPNDVDYHPVLSEPFQEKIANVKKFNCFTFNIEELRSKLDYISFYTLKNPNEMGFLNYENGKVLLSSDENTFVEVPLVEVKATEEFEKMSVPLNCSTLQLITSKVGKESENLNMYVSSIESNKLIVITFGDSNETVIIAKLNLNNNK